MMSSSELQRISLSASKSVRAEGVIEVDSLNETLTEEDYDDDDDDDRKSDTKSLSSAIDTNKEQMKNLEHLTNGVDTSPNKGNITITSSIGDITVDSVRDHLNSTVTTLHTTTTEEIVGMCTLNSFAFHFNSCEIKLMNLIEFLTFLRSFIRIEHTNK